MKTAFWKVCKAAASEELEDPFILPPWLVDEFLFCLFTILLFKEKTILSFPSQHLKSKIQIQKLLIGIN